MTPTLAFAAPPPQMDRKLADHSATSLAYKPELTGSYSLIVVMIVYLLFGAAGFFAAAQMI
jgi:hypothetical protein